jgi:hypothetical protein
MLDSNFIAGARKWWVLLKCPHGHFEQWYTYAGHDPEECKKNGLYEPVLCGTCLKPVDVTIGDEIENKNILKLGRWGFA